MKIIPNMLLFFLVFLTTTANAVVLQCTGKDDKGVAMNVEYNSDPKNETLTVNGTVHKIEAPTKNHSGVATENFDAGSNMIVYDSFIKESDTNYYLHRFNAMTDETVFGLEMKCQPKQ